MANHQPQTEAERAFYFALVALLNNRESLAVSPDQFLRLAKAVPEYALRMIEGNRTQLTSTVGTARAKIAWMVMAVEWELKQATAFIADHNLGHESEYTQFMEQRLGSHPQDFTP